VLRTMTPSDYTRFRDALGQSSGFQSWQYRLIEFTVGNRNRRCCARMRTARTSRRCSKPN
jgi:tryptophan 2,3-dioxygenase